MSNQPAKGFIEKTKCAANWFASKFTGEKTSTTINKPGERNKPGESDASVPSGHDKPEKGVKKTT